MTNYGTERSRWQQRTQQQNFENEKGRRKSGWYTRGTKLATVAS